MKHWTTKQKKSSQGAALILVLWAVFVVATAVLVVVKLVDFDLSLSEGSARRLSAREAALSGVALASHPSVQAHDPILAQTFDDGARCAVAIHNEDARININLLLRSGNTKALNQLFQLWGLSDKSAAIAVDSLKDWVDADDFRSLNGAEAADIPAGSVYSRPENRPFLSLAEMATVRGMDVVARAKPNWMDYFSVHSSGALDLQETSPDLLEAFGGLSPQQGEAIIQFRNGPDRKSGTADDIKIESVSALSAIVPLSTANQAALSSAFAVGGKLRRIVSTGSQGGFKHQISTVTEVGSTPQRYLEWNEN